MTKLSTNSGLTFIWGHMFLVGLFFFFFHSLSHFVFNYFKMVTQQVSTVMFMRLKNKFQQFSATFCLDVKNTTVSCLKKKLYINNISTDFLFFWVPEPNSDTMTLILVYQYQNPAGYVTDSIGNFLPLLGNVLPLLNLLMALGNLPIVSNGLPLVLIGNDIQ